MRKDFETHLGELNGFAGRFLDSDDAGLPELAAELGVIEEREARRRDADPDGRGEIFELQVRKQQLVRELRASLRAVEAGEVYGEEGDVPVRGEDGKLFARTGAAERRLSLGAVITNPEWGIPYRLDPETVPLAVRKRYVLEEYKRRIADLRDRQIVSDALGSGKVHEYTKRAYEGWGRADARRSDGVLAERVVTSYFQRMRFDAPAEFRLEPADAAQDVQGKVDFIVRRRSHRRGVALEGTEGKGIQFTLNRGAVDLKKEQLEKARMRLGMDSAELDDILLVEMGPDAGRTLRAAFNAFLDDGDAAGPVDSYLSADMRRDLFQGVLQGLDSSEELEQAWLDSEGAVPDVDGYEEGLARERIARS